jgi:hypothetical protein
MHFYMHSYLHKIFILVKSGCYKTVPFYTSKGSTYNASFTGVSILRFETKPTLHGSMAACTIRLRCLKEHDDMLAL